MRKFRAIIYLLVTQHWSVSISNDPIQTKPNPDGSTNVTMNGLIIYSKTTKEAKK